MPKGQTRPIPCFDEAAQEEFWRRIERDNSTGCWLWTGAQAKGGYGRFNYQGKRWQAHRVAYTLTFGPVPLDKVLDHFECNNPPCCNPWHLRITNIAANVGRSPESVIAKNARKTHCPAGHSYAEHGFRNNRGQRQCRVCVNGRRRQAYAQGKYHY